MKITPNNSTAHLRLVRPPEPATPPKPIKPAQSQTSDKGIDTFTPQGLYTSPLDFKPKSPVLSKQLLEARQRIEAIRAQLVAAKTNTPIHFDQPAPPSQTSPLNANPYAAQYPRLAGSSADANESATQKIVTDQGITDLD